jgi:hypothetical protein
VESYCTDELISSTADPDSETIDPSQIADVVGKFPTAPAKPTSAQTREFWRAESARLGTDWRGLAELATTIVWEWAERRDMRARFPRGFHNPELWAETAVEYRAERARQERRSKLRSR